MERITILLIDDHRVVRQGVRAFLSTQPDLLVVGEADNGADGVDLAAQHVPDVALMDLVMPGMDGVEATRLLKRASPRTQVIVLTSYHDDAHIFPVLKAGALSYVLKDIGVDALAEAIRGAARGEATLHPRVAARVIKELQGGMPNPLAELSERELEVLRLIANGLNNAAIAEQLVLSEKTVKGHVSNILSKLQLADRTQAAVLAWRQGLAQ
ncbi:MAG TPA: response regulator transcription factor [Roseiflexaceae bacterium]|nr:response regulator transcription factor [Roseiflexaceae bacterium]